MLTFLDRFSSSAEDYHDVQVQDTFRSVGKDAES
jgi:hypothetical protein